MPDGVNPKLSRELLGLAGEYAVASELCRRKLYAQLTMGNHKQTDILVETETVMTRIQVKAKQSTEWPAISGLYRAEDFLILVDFAGKSSAERPDFYVLNLDDWKALIIEEQGYKPHINVDVKNRISYPDGWRGLNLKTARVMQFKEGWTKLHTYLKSEDTSPA